MKIKKMKWIILTILFIFNLLILDGDALENNCINCHKTLSPFTDAQTTLDKIVVNHTERYVSCSLECHVDYIRKTAINNYQQWSDSIHSKYYVTCDKCHGGNPDSRIKDVSHQGILNHSDKNSTIYFRNIPETCGKCHAVELDNFKNSMHFQRLQAESLAPSCTTCHQPHAFKAPASIDITILCATCHNPTNLPSLTTIPNDGKNALEKANILHDMITNTSQNIDQKRKSGIDVGNAKKELDGAISIMNNVPSMWHGFNLKNFDKQIQNGMNYVQRAQNDLGDKTEIPKSSGLELFIVIGIFLFIWISRIIK
jgi:predicted CXXCH cytochrome family protein